MQTYEAQVGTILTSFEAMPGVKARRSFPNEAGQPLPRAELIFDRSIKLSRDEILARLLAGDPAISLAASGMDGLYINPQTLKPGEEIMIINQIKEILRECDPKSG
jgi:L-seryl-tRNA(Ser) seleniumtransferase